MTLSESLQSVVGPVRPSLNTLLEMFDRSLGEAGTETISTAPTMSAEASTVSASQAHNTSSESLQRRTRKRGISFAVMPIIGEGESDVSARNNSAILEGAATTTGSDVKFATDALVAGSQFLTRFVSLVRLATPERLWLSFRFLLVAKLESVRARTHNKSEEDQSLLSELFTADSNCTRTISPSEWTLLAEQLRRNIRERIDNSEVQRIGSLERRSDEVAAFANLQTRVQASRATTSETAAEPTIEKVLNMTLVSSDLFEIPVSAADRQKTFSTLQSVLLVGAIRPTLFPQAMSACALSWGYQSFTDPHLRSLLEAPLAALSLSSIFDLLLRTSSTFSTPITLFHLSHDIGKLIVIIIHTRFTNIFTSYI